MNCDGNKVKSRGKTKTFEANVLMRMVDDPCLLIATKTYSHQLARSSPRWRRSRTLLGGRVRRDPSSILTLNMR